MRYDEAEIIIKRMNKIVVEDEEKRKKKGPSTR